MAQIKRPAHYRSPPPRRIPALPNPIHFHPQASAKSRSMSTTRQQQGLVYDPVSGSLIPNSQNNSQFYEKSSYSISSSANQFGNAERAGSSSSRALAVQRKTFETEEPNQAQMLSDDDDDRLSLNRKHLPVFARFPFHVPFLPAPMETHIEDNIHKLRLRLIDSELNHQRRSTDEYIKRTQKEISLSSPTPTEYYTQNIRPPTQLVQQRFTPKIASRQTSLSTLSVTSPVLMSDVSRDRLGMEPDLPNSSDLERELEIRQIQESLNSGYRSRQPLRASTLAYDARLHLYPLNEDQQYSSSNMDDLIDSMARRHLAYRRLDAAIDHQRRSSGANGSYTDPVGTPRSSNRNDDGMYTRRTPRDYIRANSNNFNHLLRARIDHYHRIQTDLDTMEMDEAFRTNSYTKLPPITPGYDSHRFQQSLNNNYDSKPALRYPQPLPAAMSNHSEHLIELPSDIFLASRAEGPNSSYRSQQAERRPVPKARSITNRSDVDNDSSILNRQPSLNGKESQDGDMGFFTDTVGPEHPEKRREIRNLFQKAAMGVVFLMTLKHRAKKNRPHRVNPSPSAAIHKIRLQEIIVALHRVYLEPDGPIYNALMQTINQPLSLHEGLNSSSKHYAQVINIIGDALKDVISKVVDFMPKDGILGTGKNSAVANLLQDGNPFPNNYFWQCERELLQFNDLKVINIDRQRAMLLLMGIFLFRAMITTLLIKPVKYRLVLGRLSATQAANLKVLASVILHVARRVAGSPGKILAMPHEWQLSLHTDETIQPILQHAQIRSIVQTCEQSLRSWCEEYIRRIDASYGKELRM